MSNTSAVEINIHAVSAWFIGHLGWKSQVLVHGPSETR